MTSKKPASSKRAAPPRACDYTKTFLKDWERLSRSGRFDLKRLKEAMLLLIGNDAPLGPEWLDHPLKGDWADHRECHSLCLSGRPGPCLHAELVKRWNSTSRGR